MEFTEACMGCFGGGGGLVDHVNTYMTEEAMQEPFLALVSGARGRRMLPSLMT